MMAALGLSPVKLKDIKNSLKGYLKPCSTICLCALVSSKGQPTCAHKYVV
jgi:hypothetical protein